MQLCSCLLTLQSTDLKPNQENGNTQSGSETVLHSLIILYILHSVSFYFLRLF